MRGNVATEARPHFIVCLAFDGAKVRQSTHVEGTEARAKAAPRAPETARTGSFLR